MMPALKEVLTLITQALFLLRGRRDKCEQDKRAITYLVQASALLKQPDVEDPPKCEMGQYCSKHGYVHGGEAEELRERLEAFINEWDPCVELTYLQQILDEVDARDSLCFLEEGNRYEMGDGDE